MAQRELGWDVSLNAFTVGWPVGIGLLVLTKLTDLLTTILGLVVVEGLAERNPVGARLYNEFGIPGLVGSSLLGVLLVIVVVEWVGDWVNSLDDSLLKRHHLYFISYLPLILVYALATVHNSLLVLQQFT